MEFSAVKAAIKTRFTTLWTASNPTVLVFWPNEQPLNADGITGTPVDDSTQDPLPYVRIDFQMGQQRHSGFGGGIGANRWRQPGEVLIRIFTPSNTGEAVMDALIDDAAAALRGYVSGALDIWDCAPAGDGDETGNYFVRLVIASFNYDLVG